MLDAPNVVAGRFIPLGEQGLGVGLGAGEGSVLTPRCVGDLGASLFASLMRPPCIELGGSQMRRDQRHSS